MTDNRGRRKPGKLLSYFAGILKSDAGSTAAGFALALPVLFGSLGVGVDMAVLSAKQSKLQSAADQASIAAVKELNIVNSSDASISTSADNFARGVLNDPNIDLSVEVSVQRDADQVEVVLEESWTPFFAHFIGSDITPIVVDATARLAGRTNICVLTLSPSEAKAFHMDKSAELMASDCAVYSNSTHSKSIQVDKNARVDASLICSAGGTSFKKGAIEPAPTTDCPVIEDPLAARQAPALGGCDHQDLVIKSGTQTLSPGNYCGGLKITGDAKVTFSKGEFIISDGDFEVSNDANVSGRDVAFFCPEIRPDYSLQEIARWFFRRRVRHHGWLAVFW